MRKLMTLLIEVKDEDAAKEIIGDLHQAMRGEHKGICVNAMSIADEFQRIELIEQALNGERPDLIDEILSLVDPREIGDIDELEGY